MFVFFLKIDPNLCHIPEAIICGNYISVLQCTNIGQMYVVLYLYSTKGSSYITFTSKLLPYHYVHFLNI